MISSLIPMGVTLAAFVIASYLTRDLWEEGGGYGSAFKVFPLVIVYLCAFVVSLIAWLIWALLT